LDVLGQRVTVLGPAGQAGQDERGRPGVPAEPVERLVGWHGCTLHRPPIYRQPKYRMSGRASRLPGRGGYGRAAGPTTVRRSWLDRRAGDLRRRNFPGACRILVAPFEA